MDKSRPIPRALLTGMFAGTAVLAYAAGVLSVNHSKPSTWEECMVANLEKAHSQAALSVLSKHCNAYPRRG
ncbi:hypothetical protein SAMN05216535_2393 [Stutzerimonas xanthomarina]|uniref:Uncharacterized protein n=2 Tax=Stutzerimonas xanthomarina TaxID=271420 RepID=A0A1M5MQ01_9GAMM|nr:hypothetical protein SAMN05216535_2393 [Stutzerimonas xanthomarina]SHG79490.1 hypothetical protein SAMN02744645_1424 [Stutzerimonas xanthomarina DSM 18231]